MYYNFKSYFSVNISSKTGLVVKSAHSKNTSHDVNWLILILDWNLLVDIILLWLITKHSIKKYVLLY